MPDVAVVFGGPSPEHDVSVLTGLQAARELQRSSSNDVGSGHSVSALYWSKAGEWHLVDALSEAEMFLEGVPRDATTVQLTVGPGGGFELERGRLGRSRQLRVDVALVCCHGGPGEDGTLQALLDLAGVTYAGPTVAGAALGMDKLAFSGTMAAAGLPTLPRQLLDPDVPRVDFPGPYIIKPRFGGSSIGIEVVGELDTAAALVRSSVHLQNGAVIEPYRSDLFDLQAAVRTWPEPQVSAVERPLRAGGAEGNPQGNEILGYADKYVGGEGMASAPRELPAQISNDLRQRLVETSRQVIRLSAVRGVARVDFLSDGAQLYVNEINTIPGSLARYLWIDPQLRFSELLGDMVAEAQARPTHAYTTAGADGTVLRSATSIAAKLA